MIIVSGLPHESTQSLGARYISIQIKSFGEAFERRTSSGLSTGGFVECTLAVEASSLARVAPEAKKTRKVAVSAQQNAEGGATQASCKNAVGVERLWKNYFKDPTEWWDNRNNKLHQKSPDFKHKFTKQALWIDSLHTPKWVPEALHLKTPSNSATRERGTNLYGECSTTDATDVEVPRKDLLFWTRLITHLNKSGRSRQALRTYEEMQKNGVKPSSYTFVAALKACGSLRDLESAKQVHAKAAESGLESDVYVGTMLVDTYVKCGSIVDARYVFERMTHRDVFSWTAMIFGYAQMEEGELALQLYARMQQEGLVPDARAFVGALKACSSLTTLEEGNKGDLTKQGLQQVRAIHADIVRSGCEATLFVGNMLVDAYAKCGSLVDARGVFDMMTHRDVVSWNAIILGYAQMKEGQEALHLYAKMQREGFMPDDRTFVAALKACSSLADGEEGKQCDGKIVKRRCLEQVRAIHSQVVKGGPQLAVFVGTMLVDVYAKCGSLLDARRVFDKMPHRDVVSWTAMILGYAQMEDGVVALELYRRMQQEGLVPDDLTMVGALKACGSLAALEMGKEIHSQVSKTGRESTDKFLASSLIDMYGKCGSMVDAQKIFDLLCTKDIAAWNALIAGYARQGKCEVVFDSFERMKQGGTQPDAITFVSLLNVCSHVGLVDKGHKYFESMRTDFGITPTIEHYSCMVDLLGRSGEVENAMAMAKTMPVPPDAALWRTVLGACRKWKRVELGRQAFEFAIKLDNKDAAAHVLMCNIYAAAHMHKYANEIHALRMKTRAWKKPGQSWWTDTSGTVHVFAVGDQEHPESADIYAKLEDLIVTMKGGGYVPHLDSVLRDIPDDEKEDALCGHSEKLAISYALLKTPQGTTIRVVKNLRVCEDCHTAIALISKIEQRTIICRDASRFHLFSNGKCSCNDYW